MQIFSSAKMHLKISSARWWLFVQEKMSQITPRWLFSIFKLIEAEWRIYASVIWSALVQTMACRLDGAKPLPEPMQEYCKLIGSELYVSVYGQWPEAGKVPARCRHLCWLDIFTNDIARSESSTSDLVPWYAPGFCLYLNFVICHSNS